VKWEQGYKYASCSDAECAFDKFVLIMAVNIMAVNIAISLDSEYCNFSQL